jgi:SAM-dependent methyltransferase
VVPEPPAADGDFIDVNTLLKSLSVEDLNRTADEYYRQHADLNAYLGKPFTNAEEAGDLMIAFSYVVNALNPVYGSDILDFGAGTCWSTRILTQMGHAVTAMDVSPAALEIGRELFKQVPVIGYHVPPKFSVFDGLAFDLPDESFDRILCLNAFHHVPNPVDVLKEMARVLRPGGIAGFSEPGEGHSRSPQAQFEMRHYTVIENDIVIDDIERWALDAGFSRLDLAIVAPTDYRISWHDYVDLMKGGVEGARYADWVRQAASSRRVFFLYKAGETVPDSRQRRGLNAVVRAKLDAACVAAGDALTGEAHIENTGTNVWLPSDAPFGPVFLGLQLFNRAGQLLDLDFRRVHLPRAVRPGESAELRFSVEAPPVGEYRIGFDLVSERVCWFASNGGNVSEADLSVR